MLLAGLLCQPEVKINGPLTGRHSCFGEALYFDSVSSIPRAARDPRDPRDPTQRYQLALAVVAEAMAEAN